jgi:glycine cleavage system aminomethyltransferase T
MVQMTGAALTRRRAAKDRREKADFPGAERILRELKEGPPRRRVGLVVEGAPARGALRETVLRRSC